MGSRQTDKYGNPAHHTGHLGAPGTTGAFETHDPLGAPGTTGASPTTGYNGQEQLHRPAAAHHVPLSTTAPTGQGYAYGTASTMGQVGHAQVAVPHTAGLTGTYDTDTGVHTSDSDRIRSTGGYDTGSFGGTGADIGHIGHQGRHGAGFDTLGQGVGGGSYDTGGLETHGQEELGGGHVAGSDWGRTQGVKEHGGGYDTGGKKGHGQGVKEHSASGYDTAGDWTHSQEGREQGGEYDTGRDKTRERVQPQSGGGLTGTGEQLHGGITATVVEVVTEEPMQEEESKGFIDRIMEHLPGTAGGTK